MDDLPKSLNVGGGRNCLRLGVSAERLDLDVVVRDPQAPEQSERSDDHAGRAADVVDRIREAARRVPEKVLVDSSGRAPPTAALGTGQGVPDPKAVILL